MFFLYIYNPLDYLSYYLNPCLLMLTSIPLLLLKIKTKGIKGLVLQNYFSHCLSPFSKKKMDYTFVKTLGSIAYI